MMRRNAYLLLSLVAAMLVAPGCSPFLGRLHRNSSSGGLFGSARSGPAAADAAAEQARKLSESPARTPASKASDDKAAQYLNLARLSERSGQTAQAERLYREVRMLAPDNPLAYQRLAIMRTKASKWDEAEQLFAKAYELNPTDPELMSDIGYFYYLTSRPEQAEQFLQYALQLSPVHEAAVNNLALLLGEQGRFEESRELFRRVGSEAQTESNMAYVYSQRAEMGQAMDAYSRALTLDNTMRPAARGLMNLARRASRATAAEASAAPPASTPAPAVIEVSQAPRRKPIPPPTVTIYEQPPTASRPQTAEPPAVAIVDEAPRTTHRPVRTEPLPETARAVPLSPPPTQPSAETQTAGAPSTAAGEDRLEPPAASTVATDNGQQIAIEATHAIASAPPSTATELPAPAVAPTRPANVAESALASETSGRLIAGTPSEGSPGPAQPEQAPAESIASPVPVPPQTARPEPRIRTATMVTLQDLTTPMTPPVTTTKPGGNPEEERRPVPAPSIADRLDSIKPAVTANLPTVRKDRQGKPAPDTTARIATDSLTAPAAATPPTKEVTILSRPVYRLTDADLPNSSSAPDAEVESLPTDPPADQVSAAEEPQQDSAVSHDAVAKSDGLAATPRAKAASSPLAIDRLRQRLLTVKIDDSRTLAPRRSTRRGIFQPPQRGASDETVAPANFEPDSTDDQPDVHRATTAAMAEDAAESHPYGQVPPPPQIDRPDPAAANSSGSRDGAVKEFLDTWLNLDGSPSGSRRTATSNAGRN